ncbi:hypothetical protein AB4160_18450 [Shewanella sp. 10N.286.51.B8]|uniref:hypothetical protein n=1 Tax=Shewanella sp. 10N.286.51.B8 TaxID=3229708 RepID=UPI00354F09F3
MRFDMEFNKSLSDAIADVSKKVAEWDASNQPDNTEKLEMAKRIVSFDHCTSSEHFTVAAVDSTGDYPSVNYNDSFVHASFSQAVVYETSATYGLRETEAVPTNFGFCWMPDGKSIAENNLKSVFAKLSIGSLALPDTQTESVLRDVIKKSDYLSLKKKLKQQSISVDETLAELILPKQFDTSNIAIQLNSVAKLGGMYQLLLTDLSPDIFLLNTTLVLPTFGDDRKSSLFFEHLKRACCVLAKEKSAALCALSKSHGVKCIDEIEIAAAHSQGLVRGQVAEHWYLRLPISEEDEWCFSLSNASFPHPPGAVTYLIRFHKNMPVMRVDLDFSYWIANIKAETVEKTRANEKALFSKLDYTCHDQRSLGYPYPLRACQERVSLTQTERDVLKKQITAAVKNDIEHHAFKGSSSSSR